MSGDKTLLGEAMVESVSFYGCEVWILKREEQRKLLALEIDYSIKSARVSRLQKVSKTPLGIKCTQNNQFRQNSK